jgi:hypothetical protein
VIHLIAVTSIYQIEAVIQILRKHSEIVFLKKGKSKENYGLIGLLTVQAW